MAKVKTHRRVFAVNSIRLGFLLLCFSCLEHSLTAQDRVLEFPPGRNCGELLVCRDAVEIKGITWVLGERELLATATGRVEYSPDKFLRLNIPPECADDLSFLSDLPDDAIDELWIGSASLDHLTLERISRLKSLKLLHLINYEATDDADLADASFPPNLLNIFLMAKGPQQSSQVLRWISQSETLQTLRTFNCHLTPYQVGLLRPVGSLRWLNVSVGRDYEDLFWELESFPNLSHVGIYMKDQVKLTDKAIARLQKVKFLMWDQGYVDAELLRQLGALRNLEWLRINKSLGLGPDFEEGLEYLSDVDFEIDQRAVNGRGTGLIQALTLLVDMGGSYELEARPSELEDVARKLNYDRRMFRAVTSVYIGPKNPRYEAEGPLTDDRLATLHDPLSNLRTLQRLDLSGTEISTVGLKHLPPIATLEELVLDDTEIGPGLARVLDRFPNLLQLSVKGTKFSAFDWKELRQKRPEIEILRR